MRYSRLLSILSIFTIVALFLSFFCSIILSVILLVYPGVAVQKVIAPPTPTPKATIQKTPTSIPTVTVVPTTPIPGPTASADSSVQSVIIGGIIGIIGATVGSLTSYWLENKREQRRKRMDDLRDASEWARKGRRESLRRADLSGADLRGADLAGADLAFANLRRADLTQANLRDADLRGADLRDANLSRASLARANMVDAKAWGAKWDGSDPFHAQSLPQTMKPPSTLTVFWRQLRALWHQLRALWRQLRAFWRRTKRVALLVPFLVYFGLWEGLFDKFKKSLSSLWRSPDEITVKLEEYAVRSRQFEKPATAEVETEIEEDLPFRVVSMFPWVASIFLCDFLMLVVAVVLIVTRKAWLMGLIVIGGIVILNQLLLTWKSRYESGSPIIRNLLVVNELIIAPAIGWLIWRGEWLLAIAVMASALVLSIPLLIAQLTSASVIAESLEEFVVGIGARSLRTNLIPSLISIAIVPTGIDLAVGLILLRNDWETAMAVVGILLILGIVYLTALCIEKRLIPLLQKGVKESLSLSS